jgi:hypothetical protein
MEKNKEFLLEIYKRKIKLGNKEIKKKKLEFIKTFNFILKIFSYLIFFFYLIFFTFF